MKKYIKLISLTAAAFMLVACNNGNNNNQGGGDVCTATAQDDDKVHLVILAGQSGARGKALNSDLSVEEKEANYDVDIMADGYMMSTLSNIPTELNEKSAVFKPIAGGFGDSASEFGPEIGMGQTLASRYPKDGEGRKSAVLKFTACGSTFISDWYSESSVEDAQVSAVLNKKQIREVEKTGKQTGPLTNNMYKLIDKAISDLEDEGYEAVIDGVVFSHGEQDAKYDENMSIYKSCLTNFIKDVRAYVGNDKLPFVIGEAITNSAKYSNKLRDIQKEVADNDANCVLLDGRDLKTNTFEPWHMGAKSNLEFGNRAVEEIIKLNDTRKVSTLEDVEYYVPKGKKVDLPKYVKAEFDNGYEGYALATYDDYDENAEGVQEINYKVKINCVEKTGKAKVHVGNYNYVDGVLDEGFYTNAYDLPNNLGKVYIAKADTGLSIGIHINDNDINTDGEAWKIGDMGQRKQNDDFRIYVTDGEASDRYTIALSSASLLRVYDNSVNIETSADNDLVKHNLQYKKEVTHFDYKVQTHGVVNGGENSGMDMEIFMPYDDLAYDFSSELKMMFSCSNISLNGTNKTQEISYLTNGTSGTSASVDNIDEYFAI